MALSATATPLLRVALGSDEHEVGLPVLAGGAVESIFPGADPAGQRGAFSLYRTSRWLLGSARAEQGDDPEAAARQLYDSLLQAVGRHSLARVWNYVPQINATGRGGLENYRAFCRGRSDAFESHFGAGFKRQLSSASAVGSDGSGLTIVFAATAGSLQHFENPHQVAAYEYPPEHGPRSPSFARATTVTLADHRDVFISGTAAIRGHVSITVGGIEGQLRCTIENLRTIGSTCGVGADLGAGRVAQRHFKVYLRHVADLATVKATLTREILRPADHVTYVRADICRAELDVEVEATLLGLTDSR